jgi:pimeloyl-ACP methyl ester carboxylesterase
VSAVREERFERIVDGRRIEIARWIPDEARAAAAPIVLLHEGLGSIAMWRDFPALLAQRIGCDVYAYSRYGHGASEPLAGKREPGYMEHEGRVVLPALLQQLQLARPVLLGHSDGASIAIAYAGTYPERVAALVLEAPHVFVEDVSIAGIEQAKVSFETTGMPQKLARYHSDAARTFYGWNDIWLDPRFRSWSIERYLDRVACPVLVLQGEDDAYGTALQGATVVARAGGENVLLAGCGHAPHRDVPEETLRRIAALLLPVKDEQPV